MTQPDKPAQDLLSLTKASIPELVDALFDRRTLSDEEGKLPARSLQVAELIAAETVRLIRLGSRAELTTARLELARAVARDEAAELADRHPRAHRLLIGSSVALAFATAPSSSGGELSVLRSWNGMAAEIVALVDGAPNKALPRAQLRESLGIDESHLSHLLADLEAANLITRRRKGREVTVHLGRAGRSRHVDEFLNGVFGAGSEDPSEDPQKLVRDTFHRIIGKAGQPAEEEGEGSPALQPVEREAAEVDRELTLMHHDVTAVEKGWITCRINAWGTDAAGELDDRYLFWAAKVENGKIVSTKSLAPFSRGFQAIQSRHGQPGESAGRPAPGEITGQTEWLELEPPIRGPMLSDKGNAEKLSYNRLLALDKRNGEKRFQATPVRLADVSLILAAIEH